MPDDRQLVVSVLRALGIGDFLTAIPAIRGIRRAFPQHHLELICPRYLEPLVQAARIECEISDCPRGVPIPPRYRPEIAVNLHGRGPQSHRALLAGGPDALIAFSHSEIPESYGQPVWEAGEHEVRRWCRLLTESGIPADPSELDIDRTYFNERIDVDSKVVIHPGAASGSRRWPIERWAQVARSMRIAGERVVVTGSIEEKNLVGQLVAIARLPADSQLICRSIFDLGQAVAQASLVMCGDTGIAHLATALRTPSVVLFGPVSPEVWGPPVDRPWNKVIWKGHYGDPHAEMSDPGLLMIEVEEVLEVAGNITRLSI